MRISRSMFLFCLISLTGCATAPWHENLMSNQELMQADCRALSIEDKKLAENAQHAEQAASTSKGGAIFLAVLSGVAAGLSGTAPQTQSATNQENLASDSARRSQELDSRRQIVQQLIRRKGCP